MASYEEPQEGEWVHPIQQGYKMACCDCGLVHNVEFRVVDNEVEWRMFRNNRSTGQIRRWTEKTSSSEGLLRPFQYSPPT